MTTHARLALALLAATTLTACGSGAQESASSSSSPLAGTSVATVSTTAAAGATSAAPTSTGASASTTVGAPASSTAAPSSSASAAPATTAASSSAPAPDHGSVHLGADGSVKDGKGEAMPTGPIAQTRAWLEARTGAGKLKVLPGNEGFLLGRLKVQFAGVGKAPTYLGWTLDGPGACSADHAIQIGPDSPFVSAPVIEGSLALGSTFGDAKAKIPALSSHRWSDVDGAGDLSDLPPFGDTPAGVHYTFSKCGSTATTPPDDAKLTWMYYLTGPAKP